MNLKIKKTSQRIMVTYWLCPYKHRHTLMRDAKACVDRAKKQLKAEKLRSKGKSVKELARLFSVSQTTINLWLARVRRMSDVGVFPELSVRTNNALVRAGITTDDQLRTVVNTGQLQELRNIGELTKYEILNYIDNTGGRK